MYVHIYTFIVLTMLKVQSAYVEFIFLNPAQFFPIVNLL